MTDWFARPVLHVTDVDASLRFYVDRLGFTSPWRYEEDGKAHVTQVDRQGCALILAATWPEKIGKGLMFISLNVEPETPAAFIFFPSCFSHPRPITATSRDRELLERLIRSPPLFVPFNAEPGLIHMSLSAFLLNGFWRALGIYYTIRDRQEKRCDADHTC